MYAVVGYFDAGSDKKIRSMWEILAKENICEYLYQSENSPHIKFNMYDSVSPEEIKRKLENFTLNAKKIAVHFKNFGIYPNEKPIVFLDISANIEILRLQIELRNILSSCGKETDFDYFHEGIWKPDCFLTIDIEKEKMPRALEILNDILLPFDGLLEKTGLIEFHPAKKIAEYGFTA